MSRLTNKHFLSLSLIFPFIIISLISFFLEGSSFHLLLIFFFFFCFCNFNINYSSFRVSVSPHAQHKTLLL
ncbi:hypothetical protein QVD17_11800 [Tagetes erecta]|uniref:Uncharacterized protein n=1 Tax=Tagetes erecta TaxID=13708 RepID=A0AAD8P2I1_TARER|nr:hypothetical protein QVD17_11800 [Tagetes erecta]